MLSVITFCVFPFEQEEKNGVGLNAVPCFSTRERTQKLCCSSEFSLLLLLAAHEGIGGGGVVGGNAVGMNLNK